jgi:hypothetical protein
VSLGGVRAVGFAFAKPLSITEPERVFSLRFRGGGPGTVLRVLRKAEKSAVPSADLSSTLPVPDTRTAEYSLSLPPGTYFGFSIELEEGREGPVELQILEGSIRGPSGVFSLGPAHVAASDEFYPVVLPALSGGAPVLRIMTAPAPGPGAGLEVRIAFPGLLPKDRPVLTLSGEGGTYTAAAAVRPVPEPLYFHPASLGFSPTAVEITPLPPDAVVEIRPIRNTPWKSGAGSFDPVPADLSTLLEYPQKAWRHGSFEVFRWGLFPDVLIFDTENYAVQKRLFHRMAFFTEKKGYRGRLMPDSAIWDLHGWNAQNYHAEGVAAFFETARRSSFPLNKDEIRLRDYLVSQGVLIKSGPAYGPGRGGVLSISRESFPAHRRLLLTHEAFHGVFYGIEEFRRLAEKTWNELPGEQKEFWKFFFSWMNYDIGDPYLTVNEFQAYLLQQSLRVVDPYFKETVAGRLIERYPERKKYFDDLFRKHPDMFTRPARILSDFLEKTVGIRAGDAFSLYR